MKKSQIFIGALGAFALVGTIILEAAPNHQSSFRMLAKGDEAITWGHYRGRAATIHQKGIKEYWVSCKSHEHFFVKPAGLENGTETIAEGKEGELPPDFNAWAEDDDRWIAALKCLVHQYNVLNDGSETPIDVEVEAGSSLPMPAALPNYTFVGWFDKTTGDAVTVIDAEEVSVVARYEETIRVVQLRESNSPFAVLTDYSNRHDVNNKNKTFTDANTGLSFGLSVDCGGVAWDFVSLFGKNTAGDGVSYFENDTAFTGLRKIVFDVLTFSDGTDFFTIKWGLTKGDWIAEQKISFEKKDGARYKFNNAYTFTPTYNGKSYAANYIRIEYSSDNPWHQLGLPGLDLRLGSLEATLDPRIEPLNSRLSVLGALNLDDEATYMQHLVEIGDFLKEISNLSETTLNKLSEASKATLADLKARYQNKGIVFGLTGDALTKDSSNGFTGPISQVHNDAYGKVYSIDFTGNNGNTAMVHPSDLRNSGYTKIFFFVYNPTNSGNGVTVQFYTGSYTADWINNKSWGKMPEVLSSAITEPSPQIYIQSADDLARLTSPSVIEDRLFLMSPIYGVK